MRKGMMAACLALCLLAGCNPGDRDTGPRPGSLEEESAVLAEEAGSGGVPEASLPRQAAEENTQAIRQALERLEGFALTRPVDKEFLLWGCEQVEPEFAARLAGIPEEAEWSEPFYQLFGETLHVLWDRYAGSMESDPNLHDTGTTGAVRLAFAGDVNLADDWENMLVYHSHPEGLEGLLSQPLLERMRSADIFLVNNEFCFSHRGVPTAGKLYTFRSATENVEMLHQMGVDLVSLANNHVFDFGEDAFLDTLDTLEEADIPYVGAGRDLAGAMQAQYFHGGGMKIAYVAASRAEKYVLTPGATGDRPGVLWCYEDEDLLEAVADARRNADWVVVYPHWGTEFETGLEKAQTELAHKLVDAGADIVVGAHPHVLQGMEFYQGKPIAYSLGNFWFNVGWVDSALLEIELLAPGEYRMVIQPCMTAGGTTYLMEEPERIGLFRRLESISHHISIDDEGVVTPWEQQPE